MTTEKPLDAGSEAGMTTVIIGWSGGFTMGDSKCKNALVTGGAGFIGSHLTSLLVSNGWHVTVLDDLSTGCEANIAEIPESNAELVFGSTEDADLVRDLVRGCDAVFHFAAMVSVPLSIEEPEKCNEVNVAGTWNILTAMRGAPVPFLYASSAAVYGSRNDGLRREDEPPMPLSPYAASKAINEIEAVTARNVWGVPAVGFRFFNVYGPRQDPSGAYASVIPKFCDAIMKGEKPIIYGDGEQTRDFIYVDDVASTMLRMLPAAKQNAGRVFNTATGSSISVKTLLGLVSRKMGCAPLCVTKPERAGDIKKSAADISALKSALGEMRFTDIDKGLDATVAWFKNRS